ncbi:MAG: response regulator [Myxococcales bacterium]|jgi:PAS domain S-box-containing protein|nr:response regulator [Myxococcales bacterium]MBL0197331.1 response regulator [Myxococcales bacterium]
MSAPALPTLAALASSRTARGRVLIVDDNAELAGALEDVLSTARADDHSPRFQVVTATHGAEALALADAEGFDVAIVDVKLPDVSGVDLIGPLRERAPFSEVVLVTGFATLDAAMGALRGGAFAFVLKSFRPEELLATVEQAFAKVALKRERDELERRYRDLVELTSVLFVALDGDDRVSLLNRRAATLAGVSPDEALGKPLVELWITSEGRVRLQEGLARARAGTEAWMDGEARRARALEVVTGFGPTSELDTTRTRVRWHLSRGEDSMVYAIGIDVTERLALEKRAADAEALSAMGALALNLAHEIRNPLNAALLQLHLLGRDVGKVAADDEQRAGLRTRAAIVGSEIGRLNRLLTEFLELARPRGIAREPVHMPTVLDEVLALERESAEARGVTFVREVPRDGAVALGDAEKLKQVLVNLVVNALEAMKGGGTVTARVVVCDDRVETSIVDTGQGIESEVLGSVFDAFFTTKEAGTGLGLSIVRKIVDQHRGDVRIHTERGRGTTVTVSVPRAGT